MAKRKKKGSGMVDMAPMKSDREHRSVSVRKIKNGYLAEHSHDGPDGYKSETVYHPKKPTIMMDVSASKKSKATKSRMKALEGKLI